MDELKEHLGEFIVTSGTDADIRACMRLFQSIIVQNSLDLKHGAIPSTRQDKQNDKDMNYREAKRWVKQRPDLFRMYCELGGLDADLYLRESLRLIEVVDDFRSR